VKMDIMIMGKGRVMGLDTNNLLSTITIHSYASIISTPRAELDWLISSLTR